jgi:hypothetical protein
MNMQMIQHSVNDIWQMARIIADGRLFGVKSPQEAASLMLIAQAEGLHPAIAVRDYHIIQGKACLKADAMLARFQQAGGICQWECVTDAKVAAFFSHPTKSPKPVLIEWTNETVKQAQISSAMHTKYPRQMKRARVISEGVRTVLPECVCGTYAPEEIATKAAELEEIERDAAEHIKPADVTIQDTPSPFGDEPQAKPMELPAVSPVNREIIVHFMGPGNPPKKKMLRDCTDAELSTVIDTARQRYKRKAASDSDKAEAEADGKLAKEWAAWRTTHPLEAPQADNDPVAPPKAEETLETPVAAPEPTPTFTYGQRFEMALTEAGLDKVVQRKALADKLGMKWAAMQDILVNKATFTPEQLAALEANGVSARDLK